MYKMKYIVFILLFVSCASKSDKTFKRVSVERYYQQAGTVKYFLSDLPEWANVSYEGQCHRDQLVKYLDYASVMKSFDFNYEQTFQLQYTFNHTYRNQVLTKKELLTLKEEEKLFFESLARIKSGFREFKIPTFERINIVWVDDFIRTKKGRADLLKLMDSEDMMNGRPLMLSMCMNEKQLRDYLKARGVTVSGSRFLTYELFSLFSKDGNLTAREHIDLSGMFSAKQKLYFYYKSKKPRNVKGKFKLNRI
jgi:hypothetical protein